MTANKVHQLPPLGGFERFSTVDYPGHLCAVVYTQGCPCRCSYCHNQHLQSGVGRSVVLWSEILEWLATRYGLLDAVVFCGGEPTAHSSLLTAIRQVRELGFGTALHTSGVYPNHFSQLLPYLDWVGLDIKAPLSRYADVTGLPESGVRVQDSIAILLSSNIPYEIRTTVHPAILDTEDLLDMAHWLKSLGVSRWVLQSFQAGGCTNAGLIHSYAPIQRELFDKLREYVPDISVR